MNEALVKQILIALGVAFFVRAMMNPPTPAADSIDFPSQIWAGAGTDPFGMSYTVVGKAARGGM